MSVRRILLLAGAGIFLAPDFTGIAPASADDSLPGPYLGVETGLASSPAFTLTTPSGGSTVKTGTGAAFGASAGYDFGNGVRTEVESLHAQTPVQSVGGVPASGALASTSVMLNGLYIFDNGAWEMKPFVGAGIGALDVSQRLSGSTDHDWVAAYQVRGGVAYGFSQKLLGRLEYRWTQGEKPHFGIAGLPAKIDIKRDGFHVGLDYHLP
jgi:opacity protein-like surface antigen